MFQALLVSVAVGMTLALVLCWASRMPEFQPLDPKDDGR